MIKHSNKIFCTREKLDSDLIHKISRRVQRTSMNEIFLKNCKSPPGLQMPVRTQRVNREIFVELPSKT